MKRYFQILFILMFVSVFILSSNRDSLVAAPKGSIRAATAAFNLTNWDQTKRTGGSLWYTMASDPLFYNNEKGEAETERAIRKYKISRDGLIWTFYVRKGMKFHNGDEATAEDLKFTLDEFSKPDCGSPWARQLIENKISIEVKDKYTCIFKSKKPEPLMIVPFSVIRLWPKKYIAKVGMKGFAKNPVGSGPWKFVSYATDKELVFEAYTDYWGKVPEFKKLIYYMVPEEATQVAMFKRGDLNFIGPPTLSLEQADKLKKQGFKLKKTFYPSLFNINISGTWMTDSPVKDIRVRKAMSYAINREEMCRTYFKGYAEPAAPGYFAAEGTWGWTKKWKPDPYDPKKAKQLLKEAGYPQKFKNPVITIIGVPAYGQQVADHWLMLQDYWKAVGIQSEIKNYDRGAFFGLVFGRANKPGDPSWDIVGKVWTWSVMSAFFNNAYHSQNIYTSIGVHTSLNDPKVDALYDKCMKEKNLNKAKRYYQDFETAGHEQYVHFNTVKLYDQYAFGKDLGDFEKGWQSITDNFHYLTNPNN